MQDSTPFEGYFAQNQSTFDGVSEHILRSIARAAGFIAVLHPRGTVSTPTGSFVRASVWVEQEIAIATYIQRFEQPELLVQIYKQDSIVLEGLREKLMLNPQPFITNADVLDHATGLLRDWESKIPPQSFQGRILQEISMACHHWKLRVFDVYPSCLVGYKAREPLADVWDALEWFANNNQFTVSDYEQCRYVFVEGIAAAVTDLRRLAGTYGDQIPMSIRNLMLRSESYLTPVQRIYGVALRVANGGGTEKNPTVILRGHFLQVIRALRELDHRVRQ